MGTVGIFRSWILLKCSLLWRVCKAFLKWRPCKHARAPWNCFTLIQNGQVHKTNICSYPRIVYNIYVWMIEREWLLIGGCLKGLFWCVFDLKHLDFNKALLRWITSALMMSTCRCSEEWLFIVTTLLDEQSELRWGHNAVVVGNDFENINTHWMRSNICSIIIKFDYEFSSNPCCGPDGYFKMHFYLFYRWCRCTTLCLHK